MREKESPKTRLVDLRDEKDQIWRRGAAKLKQPSGEKKREKNDGVKVGNLCFFFQSYRMIT